MRHPQWPAAIIGVIVIGLGMAPLYPPVTDFANAFGLALLLAPIALGALADEAGFGARALGTSGAHHARLCQLGYRASVAEERGACAS